jgi:hypothetical protein
MSLPEEWCSISSALDLILTTLKVSGGRAQVRLIESCAAGNVRSRVPGERVPGERIDSDPILLLPDDGILGMDLRPGAESEGAQNKGARWPLPGPIPALTWEGAAIDGDALLDRARVRWAPVEINVADLRFELGHGPVTIAVAISPRVVSEKGGRPTDALRVIAEAERRLNTGVNLPSSLAGFARELCEWLNEQPNVVRASKTGKVMRADKIEEHVRQLWHSKRRSPS